MKFTSLVTLLGSLLCLVTNASAQTWQSVSGTPAGVPPSAIGAGSGTTLYSSFGASGAYKSTDNGATWTKVSSGLESVAGDLNSAAVDGRSFLKLGNRIVHGTTVQSWRNGTSPGAFYSDNGGSTWTPASTPGTTAAQFRNMVQMGNYAFAADTLHGIVWRTTDSGANWTSVRNGVPNFPFSGVSFGVGQQVAVAGTRVLLATKVWGVYASDDLGNTWYEANNGIALFPYQILPFRNGYDIITTTNGTVFASVDGSIYYSTNQGTSWSAAINGVPTGTTKRLTTLGDKVYFNTPTNFFEIDVSTLSVRGLPFTGMDTIADDAFYAYNGFLYCGGATSLKRLNLATAARTNIAPGIYENPVGGNKLSGLSHTFSVKASGTLSFTYQWRKGGVPIGPATASSYTINPLSGGDTGSYDVIVTGPGGNTTSAPVALNVQTVVAGSLDSTFAANTSAFGTGAIFGNGSGAVLAIEPMANSTAWVGGQWDRVYPNSANGDLIRINDTNGVAQDIGAGFGSPPTFGASFEDLLRDSKGRLLAVGNLTYPNPNPITTNVMRLLADNTVDTAFRVNIPTNKSAQSISHTVKVIKEYFGTNYIIGGDFTTNSGVARNHLARLNEDGSLSTIAFDPLNGKTATSVQDVEVLPDGSILVAANVNAFSGQNSLIVKIGTDGNIDQNWICPIRGSGTIFAIQALPNGKILIGGDFAQNLNQSGNAPCLACLNEDGSIDKTFNAGGVGLPTFSADVRDISLQPDGKILLAGKFTTYNGIGRTNVARLLATGQLDTSAAFPLPPSLSSSRYGQVIRSSPDGLYIYVGYSGGFNFDNVWSRYLNTFDNPVIASQPAAISRNKNGSATIRASVYSTSTITYQWYKDGVLMDGQTSDTLVLNNVQESDTAAYTLRATTQGQTLITDPAQLRVLAAPVIASAPASISILGGKPFSLTIDAFGQANLSNKWFFNGVAMGGGNFLGTNTMTITNNHIRLPDAGLYQYVVTNTLGKATASVQVVVQPQPAHISATFVGAGVGSGSKFATDFTKDDNVIISGTNLYIFGVYGFGGQERYGIGRTDFDLKTKDVSFNPPFDFSTYQAPAGGIAQSDGKLVVYGTFNNLSNYSKIIRLNTNGTVDTTFKTNGFPDQNISFMVSLPNDKFLVYGNAITKVGTHATKSFALYNSDGSPDTGFKWNVTASGINKMMAQPDGKVLVGGGFATFNGQSLSNLVRINLDGTVDSTFYGTNVNNIVNDFDLMSDGRIVIVGTFTQVGGFARAKLARLLTDGSRDTSFTLTNEVDNASNFFPPQSVVVDDEGGIFVGSTKINVNGTQVGYGFRVGPDAKYDPDCIFDFFNNYDVPNLKKLPDGRILMGNRAGSYNNKLIGATTFDSGGLGVLHGYPTKLGILQHPLSQRQPLNGSATFFVSVASPVVSTYQWYKDGFPIAGATASSLALNSLQPGDAGKYTVKVQNVYRTLYSTPAQLTVLAAPIFIKQPLSVSARLGQTVTFEAEAVGLGSLTYQWQKDGVDINGATSPSLSLTNVTASSSAIYRLVAFNSLAPAPNNGITSQGAALSVGAAFAGTVDASWNPGSGMQRSGTVLGLVEAVLWDSESKPVIGGFFDTINGTSRPNLARFNNDGSPDTGFASAGGPNNYVFDIIKTSTGQLYIGGSFGTYAGVTQNRIARLNTDGSRDSNFASATAPGNNVYRIVEATDGKIFAGHNGTPPCVWKYSNTGTRDTGTFTFSGNYNTIYAISLYGNSQILVGGGAGSYHYSYRYGTNGTFDNTWTAATSFPINSSSYVYDIGVLPDGRALVGGTFVNPDTIQGLTNLVVLGTNGRIVANTSSNLVTDGIVYDIYVYPNGKVLIGGSFTTVNRISRPGIARLNADLSVDTTFNPGLGIQVAGGGASVNSIDVRNDGKILVGGYFDTFDGAARNGVVVLNGDPVVQPLSIIGAPQAQVVVAGQNATFNVAVNGGTTLNFQWYKGNTLINGATNPYVTITNAVFADADNYKVTVTSGVDSITSTPVSLTVTAPTTLTFADWRSGYPIPALQVDPDADPDGDGLPNVVEYVLGTDPTQINERPKAQKTNVSGTDYPAVKIKRLKAASGFDIIVEASLSVDFSALISTTLVGITDLGNGLEELNVRINDPLLSHAQIYFRVAVANSVGQ